MVSLVTSQKNRGVFSEIKCFTMLSSCAKLRGQEQLKQRDEIFSRQRLWEESGTGGVRRNVAVGKLSDSLAGLLFDTYLIVVFFRKDRKNIRKGFFQKLSDLPEDNHIFNAKKLCHATKNILVIHSAASPLLNSVELNSTFCYPKGKLNVNVTYIIQVSLKCCCGW